MVCTECAAICIISRKHRSFNIAVASNEQKIWRSFSLLNVSNWLTILKYCLFNLARSKALNQVFRCPLSPPEQVRTLSLRKCTRLTTGQMDVQKMSLTRAVNATCQRRCSCVASLLVEQALFHTEFLCGSLIEWRPSQSGPAIGSRGSMEGGDCGAGLLAPYAQTDADTALKTVCMGGILERSQCGVLSCVKTHTQIFNHHGNINL